MKIIILISCCTNLISVCLFILYRSIHHILLLDYSFLSFSQNRFVLWFCYHFCVWNAYATKIPVCWRLKFHVMEILQLNLHKNLHASDGNNGFLLFFFSYDHRVVTYLACTVNNYVQQTLLHVHKYVSKLYLDKFRYCQYVLIL